MCQVQTFNSRDVQNDIKLKVEIIISAEGWEASARSTDNEVRDEHICLEQWG
jgi:hypothetical protein